MTMEIIDTQFADLHIPCAHDGRSIHVALEPLCQAMTLDTASEIRRISRDEDLGRLLRTMPDPHALTALNTLPLGAVALWLARLGEKRGSMEQRHRLAVLQQEGFSTLLDQWLIQLDSSLTESGALAMKRQFKRMQSQVLSLSDSLRDAASVIERELLRVQLNQLCIFPLNKRTPQSPVLEKFWGTLFSGMGAGMQINHARRSDRFLALNFRHLQRVYSTCSKQIDVTPALRDELKRSRHPHFLGVRVVNSKIASKSLRCWVFNLN